MITAGTYGMSQGGNTNTNSNGSLYAKTYGHGMNDLIGRMNTLRKKKKSKITDVAPKQFKIKR